MSACTHFQKKGHKSASVNGKKCEVSAGLEGGLDEDRSLLKILKP
jgi:hypothetical protein